MKNFKLISAIALIAVLTTGIASAQCAGCDAAYNKKERQKMENWKEADRIRAKMIELDNGRRNVGLKGDEAAKALVQELVQKGLSSRGE
jgi:Ni/Co efflux regulator RcnB